MPLRFNKAERDEWLRRAKKDKDEDAHEDEDEKGASVLDALESKTATEGWGPGHYVDTPEAMGEEEPHHEGWCPMCGGPSKLLGQLGRRTHYRCENCGMDHSEEAHPDDVAAHEQDMMEQDPEYLRHNFGHVAAISELGIPGLNEDTFTTPVHGAPQWGGVMEQPRAEAEPEVAPASENCAHCGTRLPYAGQGNRYCPNCHAEHDPYGRPLGAPSAPAPGHQRAGEPLSQLDEPAARWGKLADASMPPEQPPYQQKETALPYNPEAYESQVQEMHPAAQYAYQRAVQTGADPQSAYAAAQAKQGEMGKRAQEGQNTQGVQIPVINTSYHGDHVGFVSAATIKRVSHLV